MEDKKDLNLNDFQVHEKALVIAKRYINIFHQLHVITSGIEVLNKDFLNIPDDIIEEIPTLTGGNKFYQHLKNLKDGTTPINKIAPYLLPFGEEVFDDKELFLEYTDVNYVPKPKKENKTSEILSSVNKSNIEPQIDMEKHTSGDDVQNVFNLIRNFEPNPQNLESFKSSDDIKELGPDWKVVIDNLINSSTEPDKDILIKNFESLRVFDKALETWHDAVELVKNPKSKTKGEISSNLENYKTYLSMFGPGGLDLFKQIENLAL